MKCKKCGFKYHIFSNAVACKSCGSLTAQTKFSLLFVGLMIAGFFIYQSGTKTTAPPLSRQQIIEQHFSSWDGSHLNLSKLIKKNMNDPNSYEHIETRYSDQGDYLIVATKFRGNNAFGAKVVNTAQVKVDVQGNVIEVLK